MQLLKQSRLELAKDSLAMAQKLLARFEGGNIPASDMPRIVDAATQAEQAAQQLQQLAGILHVELAQK